MSGINLASVGIVLEDFKSGNGARRKFHRNKPLPLPLHSCEKELNDVYCQIQSEIQQIKDDVLTDLASGGRVDYDKIKLLFEKAELEIQEKKKDVLLQFNSKAATVSTSNIIQDDTEQNRRFSSRSIAADERPFVPKVDTELSRKSMKRNQSPSSQKQHFDLEKLKNIINPARKDTRSLFKKHGVQGDDHKPTKSARSTMKPITGSTISHPHFPNDSLANSRLSPPPSNDDARKGILNLIQRKLIPMSSSLTIVPSPIKQRQVVFHEPSNKKLNKQELRSQYNLALVKFDKTNLESSMDLCSTRTPTSAVVSFHTNSFAGKEGQQPSIEEFLKTDLSIHSSDIEFATLKHLFPSCSDVTQHPSHKFVIQDGTTRTESQDFIHFKQYYCLSWESIKGLLKKIEKLMTDFSVPIAFIDGERLADMSLYFEIGPKPTMKDLLMCVINSDDVEKIILIPGRRYLASDGEDMAATRIQAIWRGYCQNQYYCENRRKKWASGLIALTWIMKCKMTYIKRHLQEKNAEYLSHLRSRVKVFKERWSKIKTSRKVIIHIPSLGYSVKVRKSLHDIASLQNCQIGRICDVSDPNVEVIYICPLDMDEELHQYYKRLLEIMCSVTGQDYHNVSGRLKLLTPEKLHKFYPHNLCLSSLLKYSPDLIKRIKCLIKGKEAYIVPGLMHIDDLYVADRLDIPILGCEPDLAKLYTLKSGVHRIFESAGVACAPGEHDVYTRQQIHVSLARLVTQNLHISRWLFKIDDEFDGRGTAYCNITPYLNCYEHALKEAERYGEKWHEKWAHENVFNMIFKEIPDILNEYGTPVDKRIFISWQDFMNSFLAEGGIIEGCPPTDSVTGITGNVLIEPDGNIEILSVADQIHSTSPYKCWGHSLPQSSFNVALLNKSILSISNACRSRGIIGYLSVDFVTFIDPKLGVQQLWAVGLNLAYSKSGAMIQLMKFLTNAQLNVEKNKLEVIINKTPKPHATYVSKYKRTNPQEEKLTERRQRFAVVSPNIIHTNLNNVLYSVFFQICKAHGIGYDDKMKIGTTFTLVNHMKRELMGMITIGESLHDAVSAFALNLVVIHNDISSPNMVGKNNFEGAVEDLKSILEELQINLEINQNTYPTMDPKDRRLIKSARNLINSPNKETICRSKSASFHGNLSDEFLIDICSEHNLDGENKLCRPSPASCQN